MGATRIRIFRNPKYVPNGLKSYIYTLRKYGITPTRGTILSTNAQQKLVMQKPDGITAIVTADDQQNDSFYTCPVQIGTPPQTLDLDFDSGSSDLWVWSTELGSSILAAGKKSGITPFDKSKSSTFKESCGSTWKISYGDQSSASGDVGTDLVKVGDISIQNQAIELANHISEQFESSGGAGLLGLAFGSINTVQPKPVMTPIENMVAQKDIPENAELFTVYLGSVKDVSDPDKGESFYTFGAIDQSVIQASGQQISYTPVDNSQGLWMFDSTSATVNGEAFQLSDNKAIADTGTTLMLVSTQICEAIYQEIPGAKLDKQAGGYTFPASVKTDSLPTVTVAVGGKQLTIEKEHLAWAPVDSSGTTIFGGIQDRGNLPFDILGDTFLLCVYAVFDVGNTRFGCVQRADPTPSGPM